MSSEEARTDELLRDEIRLLIDAQDRHIKIKGDKKRIVESMVAKLEAAGMEPDHISREIKRIIKENGIEISDDVVEKACPKESKRKHITKDLDPLKRIQRSQVIEQSTDGSTHTAKDEPEEIPLSADRGKGVVVTTEEDEKPHKVHHIVMSAFALNALGKEMINKVAHIKDLPNSKKLYFVEHDIDERALYVGEAEEGETRDI